MSYDINFWKPRRGTSPEPQATYERLNRREAPEELESLPSVQILSKLKEAFPGFDPAAATPEVALANGHIEFFWTDKHFRLDFRGFNTGEEKNKAWQILSGFGCVCYDPQSGTLHTRDNPPEYRALTTDEFRLMDQMLGGTDKPSLIRPADSTPPPRAGGGLLLRAAIVAIILAAIVAFAFYLFR